jgi:hypothetical protein
MGISQAMAPRARLAIPILGVACALAASPTASAAPAGDRLSERIAATTASTVATVQQSAASATGRVQAGLDELSVREPVTSVVEAVHEQSSEFAQTPITPGRVVQAATSPTSRSAAERTARDAGAIDSKAARRHGAADAVRSGRLATVPASQALSPASPVKGSPSTKATSSVQSNSDDDAPELPPIPTDGGLANAAGIALLAIAALVALLSLAARHAGQVSLMSPARWEPAVYLTPIERPG